MNVRPMALDGGGGSGLAGSHSPHLGFGQEGFYLLVDGGNDSDDDDYDPPSHTHKHTLF